jgi:maleate cis-trans isomerase
MKALYRIGRIVPSSNITMETEIPAMLQAPTDPAGTLYLSLQSYAHDRGIKGRIGVDGWRVRSL